MIRSIRIAPRLTIGFLFLALSLLLVGWISVSNFRSIGNDASQMTSNSLVELEGAIELKAALYRNRVAVEELLSSVYRENLDNFSQEDIDLERKKIKEEINLSLEDFERKLHQVLESTKEAALLAQESGELDEYEEESEQVEELEELEEEYHEYQDNVREFVEILSNQGPAAAVIFKENKIDSVFSSIMLPFIKEHRIEEGEEIREEEREIEEQIQRSFYSIMGISTLSILMLIILSYLITNSVASPIGKLAAVSRDISKGDYEKRAPVDGKDEIKDLAVDFNAMADNILNQIHLVKTEKDKFLASIESISIGFIMMDLEGKIILRNPAVRKIFAFADDEWTMDNINQKLKRKIKWQVVIDKVLESKAHLNVDEIEFEGGNYLKINVVPVVDSDSDEVSSLVILLEDITEGKRLAQSKDEFFALASHELRTPLTSIRGNISLIKQHFGAKIKNKDMKSMIEDIHSSSIRLIEIVEDFLDVSRLEQKRIQYNLENFDMVALVKDSIREIEEVAKEKTLAVKLLESSSPVPLAHADKNRTKQVIINLLGNSVKFTQTGEIAVSVLLEKERVKVTVADSGIGISPKNQEALFKKFSQAGKDSLTRNATQGTGLGLYISRLIIEGMGGKINLEKSEPNKGSTFAFYLPVAVQ